MKPLSVSLFATSLAFVTAASAQDYRDPYYGNGDYDYARVIRVDPVIGHGSQRNTQDQNCVYRQSEEVYVDGDGGYNDGNGVYRRGDDHRGDDYYGRDGGYRRGAGSEGGRTLATVIGGIAGAVLGSKIGGGSGQYIGTAVGSMVGGVAGRSIYEEAQRSKQVQRSTVRVCDPVPSSSGYGHYADDPRIDGYDVTYEYAGRTYQARTSFPPGERMRVRVSVTPE